jgi:hypothetical protein
MACQYPPAIQRLTQERRCIKLVTWGSLGIVLRVLGTEPDTRQAMYGTCDVTLGRVRAAVVAVEKQCVLHILSICLQL